MENFTIAVDIGAGLGVKMGLFANPHNQIDESLLPCDEYQNQFESFATSLLERLGRLAKKKRPAIERRPGDRHRFAGAFSLRRQLPLGRQPPLSLRP